MDYIVIAIIVLIIIVIYNWNITQQIEPIINVDEIKRAVETVQLKNGSFKDFQQQIGDPFFPIYQYAKFVTLYKTKQLTSQNITRVLSH